MGQGDTLINGTVGAIISTVLYFVPVVQAIAPIGGGLVAGYMQKGGAGGGIKAGGAKGFIMVLPAIGIGTVAANMVSGIPLIGDLLTGSLAILVIIIVIHSLFFGMTGGLIGGAIAGSPDPTTTRQSTQTSENERKTSQQATDTTDTGNSKECPQCGASLAENAQFCRSCGAEIDERPGKDGSTNDSAHDDETVQTCPNCGAPASDGTKFCRKCGTALEADSKKGAAVENSESEREAQENHDVSHGSPAEADSNHETSVDQPTSRSSSIDEQRIEQPEHPAATVATTLLDSQQVDSEPAQNLLEVLADPSVDETRANRVVESAIDTIESATAVSQTIDEAKFSTQRQVKSAKRNVERVEGDLPRTMKPLLDRLENAMDDVSELEDGKRTLQSALQSLVEEAERTSVLSFRSNDFEDRALTLEKAIQNGDVTFSEPGPSFGSVVDDVKQSGVPQSNLSQELLDTLENPEDNDPSTTLDTVVTRLDEYSDIDTMVSDIEARDVRRRIQSLDEELRNRSGDVYDHLADRIRELESMMEGVDTLHTVQLYAIYQECTFYDRTLLPRLERSQASRSAGNVADMLDDVEQQIRRVQDEYITVRADHNHSIPKHFLSLSEDLLAEAERQTSAEPDRAAGTLLAAEALVDHVEELYVRNEYSVMLRRLRG